MFKTTASSCFVYILQVRGGDVIAYNWITTYIFVWAG